MVEPAFNQHLLNNGSQLEIEEEKLPGKIPEYTGEEQKLLLADKKSKVTDSRKDSVTTDSGVLSIPNEEADNKCRKCCWCMCCLPYYIFCCCCCWKEKEFSAAKPDFIKRFEKWIPDKLKHQTTELWTRDRDPIPILISLYSCDPDAVNQLSQCRINPDLSAPVRKDLEFFIPQLCSFYLQGYYDNMQQLVDLMIQASECDFYFSHRIYFFFKSVVLNNVTDRVKKETMSQAVELVMKGMYRMISEDVAKQVQSQVLSMTNDSANSGDTNQADEKYTERLFLSNSKDLVRLIVTYNMDFFYPQLQGCKYAQGLKYGSNEDRKSAYEKKNQNAPKQEALKQQILNWQEQRLARVQKVFDEYNEQGWNTQQTLEGINSSLNSDDDEQSQNLQIIPSQLQAYKQAFKNNKISARDIVLPPFREDFDDEQPSTNRYKVNQKEKTAEQIEEETKEGQSSLDFGQNVDSSNNAIVNGSETKNLAVSPEQNKEKEKEKQRKETTNIASNIYDSYLSTPNFLKRLCEIADSLIGIDNKKEVLEEQLRKLNKQLPGAVYLPFVNQSMRNYAVLHIVAEETRIFKTKERCPLLLCIEVYRPTEIALEKIPDIVTLKQNLDESSKYGVPGRTNSALQSEYESAREFLNETAMSDMKEKYSKGQPKSHSNNPSALIQKPIEGTNNSQVDYPFDNFDAYDELNRGNTVNFFNVKPRPKRNSMKQERHSMGSVSRSSGSFISAADSHNDANFDRLEWELRMKADRKNKKKFNRLRRLTNKEQQSQEFGQLVDLRASDPVKVKMITQQNKLKKKASPQTKKKSDVRRTSTLESLHNNYFYKNFAADIKEEDQIMEESDEDMSEEDLENDPDYRPGREKNQFGKSNRSSRSRSATAHIKQNRNSKQMILEPGQERLKIDDEAYKSFSGMNQVGRLSTRELQERTESSGSHLNNSQLEDLTPEQQKLISVPKSAGDLTPGGDAGVDFFKDRDYYKIFLETSKEQRQRVKRNSPFANLRTWKLMKVIMKTNDDLRQEAFTMQCISTIDQIFKQANLPLWLKPYEILALGPRCGMLEVIEDFVDISSIKEKLSTKDRFATLVDYFNQQFGKKGSKKYKQAVENFTNSLAAYSLVCYILQIKDRHNENIMVNIQGFVCHIDFGFLLSNAPGKGMKFETAPFKLTQEMVDVMGGAESAQFRNFRTRMARGFCALQSNAEKLIILIEMMLMGQSDLPCFVGGRPLIRDLKNRIFPTGKRMTFEEAQRHIDMLTAESLNNWRTRCYDNFQYCAQGIL